MRFKPGRATSPIPTEQATTTLQSRHPVSNPDGPPLPFQLSRAMRQAAPARLVSNPDGPPLPFQPVTVITVQRGIGSFKPGRATSPIPTCSAAPARGATSCFKPGRATSPIPTWSTQSGSNWGCTFQTRTGHLSHSNIVNDGEMGRPSFAFQTRTGHLSHSTGLPLSILIDDLEFQTRTGHLSHSTVCWKSRKEYPLSV